MFYIIILRKDGVYDVYDRVSGAWLFTRVCPDNVFSELSKMPAIPIDFVDESVSHNSETVKYGQWKRQYASGSPAGKGFVSSCCDMWNERETSYCPYCGVPMVKG